MSDESYLEAEVTRLEQELEEERKNTSDLQDQITDLEDDNLELREKLVFSIDAVREALDLDWSARPDQILAELKRLKQLDRKATAA